MQIKNAHVTFILPDGDDKDYDTVVNISVKNAQGALIAIGEDIAHGQYFRDPGTYGPYGLRIIDPSASPATFSGGASQLSIYPEGRDRWITDVVVTVMWDSGEGRSCRSHNIILDQDVNTANWANSQALSVSNVPKSHWAAASR